ncbi:hypothetical protein ACFCZ1_22370 [Streptomyces sp. NPDC056224]|uniref:hypothetical protein n=1 Tax=Streptomyces sp. NPDC056224 TaxID=3345750 RepID=UPI0035E21C99
MNDISETVNLSELPTTAKGSESDSQVGPRVVASSVDLLVGKATFNKRKWLDFNVSPSKDSSLIAVTAFEIKNGLPVKGTAEIHLMNTIAQNGKISIYAEVIWPDPLLIEFDFMIFN